MEKGCARAHVQMHSIYDLWKAPRQVFWARQLKPSWLVLIPAGDGQRGDQSSFQVVNPTQFAAAIHIIIQQAAAFDVCIIPVTGELGRSKAPLLSLQRHASRGHPKFETNH